MKKTFTLLQSILTVLFVGIIVWFLVYFLWGNDFALYFVNREMASLFPHILVFSTAVAIYGLFILQIQSQHKKSRNILFFFLGLIFSILPLVAFHAYFTFQNEFWNHQIIDSKTIFYNPINPKESVKEIRFENKQNSKHQIDTVYSRSFSPYFDFN